MAGVRLRARDLLGSLEGITDDAGELRIESVEAGTLELDALLGGSWTPLEGIVLPAGGLEQRTYEFRPIATFEGRVVAEIDGRPVAGASIQVGVPGDTRSSWGWRWPEPREQDVVSCRGSAEGGFRMLGAFGGTIVEMKATAPGFLPLVVRKAVPSARDAEVVVEMRLEEEGLVEGRVLDASGSPKEGAIVELEDRGPWCRGPWRPWSYGRGLNSETGAFVPERTSDARGHFAISGLRRGGRHRLMARVSDPIEMNGHADVVVPADGRGTAEIAVRPVPSSTAIGLSPEDAPDAAGSAEVEWGPGTLPDSKDQGTESSASLRLRFRAGGAGIDPSRTLVKSTGHNRVTALYGGFTRSIEISQDGTLTGDHYSPGDYTIEFRCPAAGPGTRRFTLEAGTNDLGEIVLDEGRTITGCVLAPGGRRLPGVFVQVNTGASHGESTVTRSDGQFILRHVTKEEVGLLFDDGVHIPREVTLVEGAPGALGDVELEQGGLLRVTATGPDGSSLAGWRINIARDSDPPPSSSLLDERIDALGRLEARLPSGPYVLMLLGPEDDAIRGGVLTVRVRLIEGQETPVEIRLPR